MGWSPLAGTSICLAYALVNIGDVRNLPHLRTSWRGNPTRPRNADPVFRRFAVFGAMVESVLIFAAGRWMPSNSRRIPGLLLRGAVWHIDKVIYGRRICESTGTRDLTEAQALLAHRVTQARRVRLSGEQREHTFREAADKFLAENGHKRSLERDRRALAMLDPFIGLLPLQRVHHDTLSPYIRSRLANGRSPGTINRDLAVVKRILRFSGSLY